MRTMPMVLMSSVDVVSTARAQRMQRSTWTEAMGRGRRVGASELYPKADDDPKCLLGIVDVCVRAGASACGRTSAVTAVAGVSRGREGRRDREWRREGEASRGTDGYMTLDSFECGGDGKACQGALRGACRAASGLIYLEGETGRGQKERGGGGSICDQGIALFQAKAEDSKGGSAYECAWREGGGHRRFGSQREVP